VPAGLNTGALSGAKASSSRTRDTKTSYLIRNLAFFFLRRCLTIYIDNYLTSIALFLELYTCEFGVIGIIRLYKEFLEKLKQLKDQFATKLE
jgi:hypothetical protein